MIPSSLMDQLKQSNLCFAVTGGSGWLGQATLSVLADALGDDFADRVAVFGSGARGLTLPDGRTVACQPLDAISELPQRPWMFLHYAFLTKDRVQQITNTDYIRANVAIADTVEAAVRRVGAAGMFVPSSGAVYRTDRMLDRDMERNPYGTMKLSDEQRFSKLSAECGFPLALVRVFNLAGPGINKFRVYALASIIANILRDEPIRLNAAVPVIRSYVHIGDLLSLVFSLLLAQDSKSPPVFDTAGEREIEVGELASLAANLLGKPNLPVKRPEVAAEPVSRYVGDGTLMQCLAQKYSIALRDLPRQITDTADYLLSLQT